jgi:transposase
MLGMQERGQEDLFVAAPLRDLIPEDHILRLVDGVLDLSWLRDDVRDLYDESTGRPGIDPEAAMRLMLAGFLLDIVRDRKLMREAQVNIAIRWFAGYRLHERLPDHSSLTRIRQRWGVDRFRTIFQRTVKQCVEAGLVGGETIHIDATLIRADVSWESLTERHVEAVRRENEDAPGADDRPSSDPPAPRRGRPRTREPRPKKYSPTDPDATLTTSCKQYRMEPCYKQHTAVDDQAGVIVDVHVTTGEASEGTQLPEQLDRIEANTGKKIQTVTADGGYAHAGNYAALEERGVEAIIPPQPVHTKTPRVPARRFTYDQQRDAVICPVGKVLQPSHRLDENSRIFRARTRDCRPCPLRSRCFSAGATTRVIRIADGQAALLRARRRHARRDAEDVAVYTRHRWRAEGAHGEAKTQHGLRRAVRRGMNNVAIQSYLTAAVMNLKRIGRALWRALTCPAWCASFIAPAIGTHRSQRSPTLAA